jgi:hypothetical protein
VKNGGGVVLQLREKSKITRSTGSFAQMARIHAQREILGTAVPFIEHQEDPMLLRHSGTFLIGVTAFMALGAIPASASDSTVTFTATGGSLSISSAASVTLSGGTTTTVTDARGTATGWTASVYSTTGFTASGNPAITNAAVTYTSGSTTGTTAPGTPTITAASAGSPGATTGAAKTAYTYANATAGGNTISWNPTMAVTIPLTAQAGAAYSGTVSHQVA